MVIYLPPNAKVCGSKPGHICGKVGSCLPVVSSLQKLDQLYVLVSSSHKTNRRDMTYTVLKVKLKPE